MEEKKKAITGKHAQELLRNNKFTPNPEGFISPIELEENAAYAWTDINAGAVRRGDEIPEHPIRLLFKKVPAPPPMHESIQLEYIRELTAEEAKTSKALGRDDQPKISPWPSKT
jgi:hypothetical protein